MAKIQASRVSRQPVAPTATSLHTSPRHHQLSLAEHWRRLIRPAQGSGRCGRALHLALFASGHFGSEAVAQLLTQPRPQT